MEKIYIKNMVCNRCVKAVEQILEQQQIPYQCVKLGEVSLPQLLLVEEILNLKDSLERDGFQLLDDQRAQLIEKIKNTIVKLIHQQEKVLMPLKISVLLEERTGVSYTYLSSLFSETEGITVEKYLIAQRIERAKELLTYEEMSLGQIAYQLGYSSTAHLSAQFKKVSGMTPSTFKRMTSAFRKPLDEI